MLSVCRFSVIVAHPSDEWSEKRPFDINFIGDAKNLKVTGLDICIFSYLGLKFEADWSTSWRSSSRG